MEKKELIEKIYSQVENSEVDKAVYSCLRLARNNNDYFNTAIFLRELFPDKKNLYSTFFQDVIELNDKAKKDLWNLSHKHWLDERTLDFNLDESGNNVYVLGVGDLTKSINDIETEISEMNVPNGMDPFDIAAFTESYHNIKSKLRLKLIATTTILERIRTRCFNYASLIEKQFNNSNLHNNFLDDVQQTVNNYFSMNSENSYLKLQKAVSLLDSKQIEDAALLLTSIRRAIATIANYFYPPKNEPIICSDGKSRKMGEEQYLNRLQEYCASLQGSGKSNKLFMTELEYFIAHIRCLNDLSCKGVHSEVTISESKQGLIQLYMILYNIIKFSQFN